MAHIRREAKVNIDDGHRAAALFKSLLARKAIPEVRLRYFADPDYFLGKGKGSIRDHFLSNSRTDEAMYQHAHFLQYLRYFIFGSLVPHEMKREFLEECNDFLATPQTLSKLAKSQAKKLGSQKVDWPDEYYRLALDCGAGQHVAAAVRNSLKAMKKV
jgi:hypothetical protein